MSSVMDLVEAVADATGEPVSTVRMVARRLIDDEVLPKSVGRRIAQVTTDHAGLLLFATLASPAVKDATRTALAYADLAYQGKEGADTALQAISDMLQSVAEGKGTSVGKTFVEICTSWPEVIIQVPAGTAHLDVRFVEQGKSPNFWQSEYPKRTVTVPGICLCKIALTLGADLG